SGRALRSILPPRPGHTPIFSERGRASRLPAVQYGYGNPRRRPVAGCRPSPSNPSGSAAPQPGPRRSAAPLRGEAHAMLGKIDCFGLTDRGRVRPENEDQFLIANLNKSMQVYHTSLNLDNQTPLFGSSHALLLLVPA